MLTNQHVISRNEDKLLLRRECNRQRADLDWIKFPQYLQIIITAPANTFWRATGTSFINHQVPAFDNQRDAVSHVIMLMSQGTEQSSVNHDLTCECDQCEQGLDLPEIDFSTMSYGQDVDLADLDA
jgi:hypothetical protein